MSNREWRSLIGARSARASIATVAILVVVAPAIAREIVTLQSANKSCGANRVIALRNLPTCPPMNTNRGAISRSILSRREGS